MARLVIVGGGKIAFDKHIPSIAADPGFELVGIVDPTPRDGPHPTWPTLAAAADAADFDALAVCTPPPIRFALACEAVAMGKHVLLEKPPCASVLQLEELERRAAARGITLYTAWHSQHAPALPMARDWLAGRGIERIEMTWCEDVRKWHPGQRWLWEAGGLGIFDPTINALSILVAIADDPLHLDAATFQTPENSDTPIAATLAGATSGGAPFSARLDFLQTGLQTWTIAIDAGGGRMEIAMGGAELTLDGRRHDFGAKQEYPSIYARFGELIRGRKSEVEIRPMIIAADAFLIAKHVRVEAFYD